MEFKSCRFYRDEAAEIIAENIVESARRSSENRTFV